MHGNRAQHRMASANQQTTSTHTQHAHTAHSTAMGGWQAPDQHPIGTPQHTGTSTDGKHQSASDRHGQQAEHTTRRVARCGPGKCVINRRKCGVGQINALESVKINKDIKPESRIPMVRPPAVPEGAHCMCRDMGNGIGMRAPINQRMR